MQLDQSATEEIAARAGPFAALPPLPSRLLERNEPVALDRTIVGQQIGVGRAGALDDPDAGQKIDPAARSA
jgi:hypothetical protein